MKLLEFNYFFRLRLWSSKFSPFLVFWKLVSLFLSTFSSLSLISLGLNARHGHALVSDAVSLVLLLSKIHDTTKSFVIALEDGEVVVSIVLITVLLWNDTNTINWVSEFQRLFDTVLHIISHLLLGGEVSLTFCISVFVDVRLTRKLHHFAISLVSLNHSPSFVLVDHMESK